MRDPGPLKRSLGSQSVVGGCRAKAVRLAGPPPGVTLLLEQAAVKALESDQMEPVEVAGLRNLTET